jgi:short-subunit dehydrogenase involved in D-alanine esterification of teichoic acids
MTESLLARYFVEAVLLIQEKRSLVLVQEAILRAVKVVRLSIYAARKSGLHIVTNALIFRAKNLKVSLNGG